MAGEAMAGQAVADRKEQSSQIQSARIVPWLFASVLLSLYTLFVPLGVFAIVQASKGRGITREIL